MLTRDIIAGFNILTLARISQRGRFSRGGIGQPSAEPLRGSRLWVEPVDFNFCESSRGQWSPGWSAGLFSPRVLVRQAVAGSGQPGIGSAVLGLIGKGRRHGELDAAH